MPIQRIKNFLNLQIWELRISELTRPKAYVLTLVRVIVLSYKVIRKHNLNLRASALTFYTLLSIVPVMATLFGIAKGFSLDQLLERQLIKYFSTQEDVLRLIIQFSQRLLESTQGGIIAGAGVVFLIWSIIKVFEHMENSVNLIWEVEKGRPFTRKLSDYMALMFISPFVLIISSGITVLVRSKVEYILEKISFLHSLTPTILQVFKLSPLIIFSAFFAFLFVFLPYTKVKFRSALIGGLLAGTLFYGFQLVYVEFQINISKYNAVYGSFAAFPLFITWLQISWIIVLYGSTLSYAVENANKYELGHIKTHLNIKGKIIVCLRFLNFLTQNLKKGNGKVSIQRVHKELHVPFLLIQEISSYLKKAGIIYISEEKNGESTYYQLARDPDMLTISYVLNALYLSGLNIVPITNSVEIERIKQALANMQGLLESSSYNLRLKDI